MNYMENVMELLTHVRTVDTAIYPTVVFMPLAINVT